MLASSINACGNRKKENLKEKSKCFSHSYVCTVFTSCSLLAYYYVHEPNRFWRHYGPITKATLFSES